MPPIATEHKTKTESTIEDFAEELGRLLGTARAKAEGWLGQRQQITKTLEGIRDEASNLLSQLGDRAQTGYERARRGRPPGIKRGPGRPRKTFIEAAATAQDRGAGRAGTLSPEGRARIAAAQKARWAKIRAAKK
jgi:hypothetical protein